MGGVIEVWLNECTANSEILPTDYVIYRKDRTSQGGGVLLAVHDSVSSKFMPSPNSLEVAVTEISRSMY